jgi:hypothetical protein
MKVALCCWQRLFALMEDETERNFLNTIQLLCTIETWSENKLKPLPPELSVCYSGIKTRMNLSTLRCRRSSRGKYGRNSEDDVGRLITPICIPRLWHLACSLHDPLVAICQCCTTLNRYITIFGQQDPCYTKQENTGASAARRRVGGTP